MATLNTFINPLVDSGERFAEEVVEDCYAPEDDEPAGVEIDGHVIAFPGVDSVAEMKEHLAAIRRVIAAAWEAGREFGQKEPR